jgi:hypothetical protein
MPVKFYGLNEPVRTKTDKLVNGHSMPYFNNSGHIRYFSISQKPIRIYLNILNKEQKMKEILILIAFIGIWYLLQVYILPKLGIST